MQLACQVLGGEVKPAASREFGRAHLPRPRGRRPVRRRAGRDGRLDEPRRPGADRSTATSSPLAATDTCPVAAVRHRSRPVFGLQFHPEVSHTPHGSRILRNFLYDVCGCQGLWQMRVVHRPDGRRPAPSASATHRVICGLSGGVDSSVTAALLLRGGRAAGRVHLRGQRPAARRARPRRCAAPSATTSRPTCTSSTPRDRFLDALAGVTDPQEKRQIIGHVFIDVFKDEALRIDGRAASWPRARSTPT